MVHDVHYGQYAHITGAVGNCQFFCCLSSCAVPFCTGCPHENPSYATSQTTFSMRPRAVAQSAHRFRARCVAERFAQCCSSHQEDTVEVTTFVLTEITVCVRVTVSLAALGTRPPLRASPGAGVTTLRSVWHGCHSSIQAQLGHAHSAIDQGHREFYERVDSAGIITLATGCVTTVGTRGSKLGGLGWVNTGRVSCPRRASHLVTASPGVRCGGVTSARL